MISIARCPFGPHIDNSAIIWYKMAKSGTRRLKFKLGREGSISSKGGFHVWSGRPQWTKSFCAEFRAAPYRQNLDRAGPPAKAYLPPGDQSSNRQAARPQVAAKAFRARDRDRRSRGQLPGLPPLPRDDTRSAAPPGTVAITDPRARTRFVILFAKARMGWRETGVDEHRGKPGGRMIYRVQRPRSSATNSGAARRCRRDLLQSSAPPTGYSS